MAHTVALTKGPLVIPVNEEVDESVLSEYYSALQKLLPKKILEKLLVPYTMKDEKGKKRMPSRSSIQPRLENEL